jgi:predicted nucleic acid-binding protein
VSPSVAYLLDTNVVSEMMRPNPEPRVAACIDGIAERGVGLASITVWEILDGIGRLDPGRRREKLLERFRAVLDEVFEGRVLAWTGADAQACAAVMEKKRRRGEPLDDHLPDAMLAGTVVRRGLILVTRNTSEFRHAGLHVVNPWTAPG